MRTERSDLECLDRQLEIVNRTSGAREVQHAVKVTRDVRELRNVVLHEAEPLIPDQVRDVVGMAGDEVVEANDMVAVSDESIGEVRAQESGDAGDEHSHDCPIALTRLPGRSTGR